MIQCVCLNPALQRTLTINHLQLNTVNRAVHVTESVGGKGVNVSRVLKTLGQSAVITGFIGGDTGVLVKQLLDHEGLTYDFVPTTHKTRICTTLLDPLHHTQTELVEEGSPVTTTEVEAIYQVYQRYLSSCPLVIISGTAPVGVPEDIYHQMMTLAHAQKIPVLVDTQKQLLLHAIKAKPFLIKINREELLAAFPQLPETPTKLQNSIQRLLQAGVEWVILTHRHEKTWIANLEQCWSLVPPTVKVVNPMGCGDAMLAGLATDWMQSQNMLSAVCLGTACGSANALTSSPGVLDLQTVKQLLSQITIEHEFAW